MRHMPVNRLRELREESGLSQVDLAQKLNPPVDGATVSRWERRVSGIPDPRKQELAEFFGVSVPFLMNWDKPNGDNGEKVAA